MVSSLSRHDLKELLVEIRGIGTIKGLSRALVISLCFFSLKTWL
jgi:hypothetical protein